MADDLLALGQAVMAAQPFSVLLGTRLTAMDVGYVELMLPLKPEFAQHAGYVHGGVISCLADTALSFVGGSALGSDVLSAEFKLNFLRPGQGEKLIVRAHIVASSGRQAVCRCDIFAEVDGQERLCATALGTIVKR